MRPSSLAFCALLLCGIAHAQTVIQLPTNLNTSVNAGANVVSNCSNANPIPATNCTSSTLQSGAQVSVTSQTSIVLGPGFTAVAPNSSTSLLLQVVPPPPSITSVTPLSGSATSQSFIVAATSPYWNNQGVVELLFSPAGTPAANTCYVEYYQASNLMYLLSDDLSQMLGGASPGTSGASAANSQCTLNIQNSSASPSGNSLSVVFALSFKPAFTGVQQISSDVYDGNGETSNWMVEGSWEAYGGSSSQSPAAVSITPNGLGASTAQFTFTSSDPNGAAKLSQEYIYFGATNPGCTLWILNPSNTVFLASDDGTQWMRLSSASVSNHQCAVSAVSGSDSGNNWTVTATVMFSTSFAGTKQMLMNVYDTSGVSTGNQNKGTWTVPSSTDPIEYVRLGGKIIAIINTPVSH